MLNAISHTAEAQPLLEKGGVELNECVIHPGATFINVAAIRVARANQGFPYWRRH